MAYDPYDEQVFRDHVRQMREMSGHFGALSRSLSVYDGAVNQGASRTNMASRALTGYTAALNKSTYTISSGFSMLGKGADEARDAFSYFAKTTMGAFGGAAISRIVDYVGDLTGTYKRMAEIGQGFNGGLFDMAKTAAQSGVTLDEFTRMMQTNSVVAAQLAGRNGGLGVLAKSVRVSAEQFGQFGYTMQGMNDLTGEYLETMRLTGQLDQMNEKAARDGIVDLAKQTSSLAIAFGKSRTEITKTSMEAQRNAIYQSKLMQMTGAEQERYSKTIGSAITALSAQAGPAGSFFSGYLAQIAGGDGSAVLAPQTQTLVNAAMPQVASMMEGYYARMKDADPAEQTEIANDMMRDLQAEFKKSLPQLNLLARAGNKEAEEVIQIFSNIKVRTKEELEDAKKKATQADQFTRAMNNFDNIWNRITGAIREKFYPILMQISQSLMTAWEKFENSQAFSNLMTSFEELGKRFSKWVDDTFTPANLEGVATWISEFLKVGATGLVPAITTIKDNIETVGTSLKYLAIAIAGSMAIIAGSKLVGGGIAAGRMVGGLFKGTAGAAAAGVGSAAASGAVGAATAGAASRGAKGMLGRAIPGLGVGLSALMAYKDIKDIQTEYEAGRLNDDQYREQMTKAISGHLGGAGGALLGGVLGGIGGPMGSILGAGAGGMAGSAIGSYVGTDWAAGKIFDTMFANGAQARPAQSTPATEEMTALRSRLDEAERRLTEAASAAQTSPAARMEQLIAGIEELKKAIKEQTEILATQNSVISNLMNQSVRGQRTLINQM